MKSGVRILLIMLLWLVLVSSVSVTFVEIRRYQTLVLPTPTGPYAVGRREYVWTDQSRYDSLAPHAGSKRELIVWVWYPALHEPGSHPICRPSGRSSPCEQHCFIGQQLLQSNDSIQAHSLDRVPLSSAAARYPVLIFEPGLDTIPMDGMQIIQSCDTSRRKEKRQKRRESRRNSLTIRS
jgi:hypothetical protein